MDDLHAFATAAETGSFTLTAERLGLTPSAVSRIVTRLEDRLGVRLFNRTTRRIDLTPEGETYLAGVRFILKEMEEIEAAVGESSSRPKGLLRINSGTAFGLHQLMPHLPEFMDRYPDLEVSVDITDRRIDIAAERADVAIRTGPIGDDRLVARPITTMRRVICAAPGYLARHGAPQTPEDLAHHRCVVFTEQPALMRWPFQGPDGPYVVTVAAKASVSSGDALAKIALAGAGIVRIGDTIVAESIRAGALVPLLVDRHIVEEVPISAVYLPGRHRAPKVRAFVDFLVEKFAHAPWRAGGAAASAPRVRPL